MVEVELTRALVKDMNMHTPEMGWTSLDFEMVTSVSALGSRISLHHSGWEQRSLADMSPTKHTMPADMAKRLIEFCDMTFCANNPNYDCHTFVGFLMGWQDTVAAGSSTIGLSGNGSIDFTDTTLNQAYVAIAPGAIAPYAHSFIGSDRRGIGFGVAGPGMPIVMSPAEDLKRSFGATKLFVREPLSNR